jgi:hypothetical protein
MRHYRDGWMPTDQRRCYYFGVDLGQRKNHTSLVVLERHWKMATPWEFLASAGRAYHGEWVFEVIQADRVALGTPYTEAADWVLDEMKKIDERLPRTLILDGSGVGTAVKDFLRRRGLNGASLINAVITGGERVGYQSSPHATYVSRLELMTRLAVAVENREFSVDRKRCKGWAALREELLHVKRQGKPEGGVQDDLAFALALAVWWGLKI